MQISRATILSMRASRMMPRRIVSATRSQQALFSSQMDMDDDEKMSDAQFREANQITLKSQSGKVNYPPMTDFNMTPFLVDSGAAQPRSLCSPVQEGTRFLEQEVSV